ncbi:ferroxidase fet3 [Podila minutissima]|uniref:Ferroxidase fet3 n=1 Tax=Podila minutissima TaxID=64525 RepID=A0A9P5SQW1_9FUNG|nr:ferroxidase fet3 [Podila minutissima]
MQCVTKALVVLSAATAAVQAAVVTYNWNITYVNTNADGLFERRIISINGQFPPPAINVMLNDTLVINTGTYWIHGHHKGHYVDGLRAPLIIHNPNEAYHYDNEYTIAFAGMFLADDWYHQEHAVLLAQYLSIFNPSGAEPIPQSGLINQATDQKFQFVPGKTYRLRVINMSALAMFHFHIDGHDMQTIEIDGVDVVRTPVASFPVSAAQRYSVLVTAKNSTANYLLHGDMNPMMFDSVPAGLQLNVTGMIVYSDSAPLAPEETSEWPDFEDATITAITPKPTTAPNTQYVLNAAFSVLDDYINKAAFNDITYMMPKHPLILAHNDMIEIVINNQDAGNHPFHLHGHVFQVVGRGDGVYDPASGPYPFHFNTTENPLRRDTVLVRSEQNLAIRFKADNPGAWFFHCHIEWHLQAGLATTMIEAPEAMAGVLTVDPKHFEQCKALGIPYEGNAAGNQGLGLTGQNVGPNPLSGTFTAKGNVALVFTIIAALMGLATVIWYAHDDEVTSIRRRDKKRKTKTEEITH